MNPLTSQKTYDLKSVELPYLAGRPLKLFVSLLESPLGGLLVPSLLKSSGIARFRERQIDEAPALNHFEPESGSDFEAETPVETELRESTIKTEAGFHLHTIHDYARAYREGTTDPATVAQRILDAIRHSDAADPPLRSFIAVDEADVLAQAQASAARIRQGQALSIFDGVPVAVKDEMDMIPYPTTVGTAFLGQSPAAEDSTVVAKLRAVGALLLGKTNMHEIGIGVTGLNPHYDTPRNPYQPAHYPGGSSSGSAVAVAAGLCPVAIGADGGGSIRIPASFCGVVGLKPTFGRVSEFGAAPLDWSVAHIGPLATTATDTALVYQFIAGPDAKDPMSLHQPSPTLSGWDDLDLSDLTLGVYWSWFRHADSEVVSACEQLLGQLETMGATVQEIVIPDLEAGRVAHVLTIAGEMSQAMQRYDAEHRRDFGLDVRLNLALARSFTARDYIQAQQVRTQMRANFNRALGQVDVIITPTTGIAAPAIPPTALPHGDSDLTTLTEIMRFATPANLIGLPAISFPAGYSKAGLPIGMQGIGRAWSESTLLRLALASEQVVERRKPKVHHTILTESS